MRRRFGLVPGFFVLAAVLLPLATCGRASQPAGGATPVYNPTSGRLEQLVADQNADGKPEARAFMDGAELRRIELDRNQDGKPDRWEYYDPAAAEGPAGGAKQPVILRVEQADGPDDRITRREIYEYGRLMRVEEDTDLDGRIDKWERYVDGQLRFVDLDLDGRGVANQRLTYAADGSVSTAPLARSEAP